MSVQAGKELTNSVTHLSFYKISTCIDFKTKFLTYSRSFLISLWLQFPVIMFKKEQHKMCARVLITH
jgi:hypothetical protein